MVKTLRMTNSKDLKIPYSENEDCMKLSKYVLALSVIGILSSNAVASTTDGTKLSSDEFKRQVEEIMNKKKTLIVDSPEVYINNLNTTEFVRGLMYETSIVIKFLAEHSKDGETLNAFNREFTMNTSCFATVVGNADHHFETIYKLTLPTPELKAQYEEGYGYMVNRLTRYKLDPSYHKLCVDEKQKAMEYYDKISKEKS